MENIQRVMEAFHVYQNYKNWYVLEEAFPWKLDELYETVFNYLDIKENVPVVFCHTNEANRIVNKLGEEEQEFLYVPSGLYWREVNVIFVFRYDERLALLETLFHEHRHVWQNHDPEYSVHFDSDKKLSYNDRVTEKDAFAFAAEKIKTYIKDNLKQKSKG